MARLFASMVIIAAGVWAWSSAAAFQSDLKNVSSAASDMVRAQDPQTVVAALLAGKYKAELGKDKAGDPMISSEVAGTRFQVVFYNCTANKECATVTFHSGYAMKNKPAMAVINQWNRSKRFGRAYLDKVDDPVLEMDVDLDDGGLSRALFLDNLDFWSAIVPQFEKHIGYRK